MFKNFEDVQVYLQEQGIRMIDLKFCDLWGRWHHVTLSAFEFTPGLLTSGVGFDGSSVGFRSVKSGDMVLIPDLATGFRDPFWNIPTLSFICNIAEADTKQMFAGDPREILRRADKYLRKTGIADESHWGPEYEFYVFSNVAIENDINVSSYRFESLEAAWNLRESSHGHYLPHHGGYHAIPPSDQLFELRSEMLMNLESVGIRVKYHHHEVGGPGQCEIETPMMKMMDAADASMVIKYMAKMTAHQAGQTVTFLPKPLYGEAGSGMHFHMQLFKNKVNTFYDPTNPLLLSQDALFFIGGLLTHAPALLAFTNPTTNSYRRLIPGFEAPVNSFFSVGNRSAAIRIPKYATRSDQVRFEFRPPDASCNPYLAMAAMLMAGLDGINKKIDPSAAGFGPFNEDVFSWTPEQRAQIKCLPTSLTEAINALKIDNDFLTTNGVFDSFMIGEWIKAKQKEEDAIRCRPHPYEIQLYYDL